MNKHIDEEYLYKHFPKRLEYCLQYFGISAPELAKKIGTSKYTIYRYLNNESKARWGIIRHISTVLGCSSKADVFCYDNFIFKENPDSPNFTKAGVWLDDDSEFIVTDIDEVEDKTYSRALEKKKFDVFEDKIRSLRKTFKNSQKDLALQDDLVKDIDDLLKKYEHLK